MPRATERKTAMMRLTMAAAMLTGMLAMTMLATTMPAAADEDCDTVVKAVTEALAIATKNFETTMGELKDTMSKSADDKTKAAVKNKFCSAGGEMLGTTQALRAVAGECSKDRSALASLDKSVGEIETAVDGACK
jgi:predicted sugar kinase